MTDEKVPEWMRDVAIDYIKPGEVNHDMLDVDMKMVDELTEIMFRKYTEAHKPSESLEAWAKGLSARIKYRSGHSEGPSGLRPQELQDLIVLHLRNFPFPDTHEEIPDGEVGEVVRELQETQTLAEAYASGGEIGWKIDRENSILIRAIVLIHDLNHQAYLCKSGKCGSAAEWWGQLQELTKERDALKKQVEEMGG